MFQFTGNLVFAKFITAGGPTCCSTHAQLVYGELIVGTELFTTDLMFIIFMNQ